MGHAQNKNYFFSRNKTAAHKLSKTFYFMKITYVLAELWTLFYCGCFFAEKDHIQPQQLWNAIDEYLSKTEASADKQLIETILGNLIETNIIVNRKAPNGLDSFHILEFVEAL